MKQYRPGGGDLLKQRHYEKTKETLYKSKTPRTEKNRIKAPPNAHEIRFDRSVCSSSGDGSRPHTELKTIAGREDQHCQHGYLHPVFGAAKGGHHTQRRVVVGEHRVE